MKGSLITYAETLGEEITPALRTYGNVTNVLGAVGGGIAVVSSAYNMIKSYNQNGTINAGDAGNFVVGGASVAAAVFLATNPVGWAIGIGATIYFAGRFIYQQTNQ